MKSINAKDYLSSGKRYEDVYGGFMSLFHTVAENQDGIYVHDAPTSWESLLYYLGAYVVSTSKHFREDEFVVSNGRLIPEAEREGRLRELVEFHSTLRPELADALYKSDVEWDTKGRRHQWQREFVVTNNGSFHRPEVLRYLNEDLPKYQRLENRSRHCVLVPCAADKPYPAPLHQAILNFLPPHYELIIATGVLGLVPRSLWDVMPLYDSGIPNEWRLMHVVKNFFGPEWYTKIVVYSDFYNIAIQTGLMQAGFSFNDNPLKRNHGFRSNKERSSGSDVGVGCEYDEAVFVNPVINYQSYLNLLDPSRLNRLKDACR